MAFQKKGRSLILVYQGSVQLVVCKCNTTDLETELQHKDTVS